MYCFHLSAEKYYKNLSGDLEYGWSWLAAFKLKRLVDTADFEWKTWKSCLLIWLRFVTFHLFVNQILKRKLQKFIILFNTGISFCWLLYVLGPMLSLIIFLQPLVLQLIFQLFSLTFVWVACLSLIYALHSSYFVEIKDYMFEKDYTQEYLFAILITWTIARSISYLVDTSSLNNEQKRLRNCYYYCFYLPLLPTGPLLLYNEFQNSVEKTVSPWCWRKFFIRLLNVLRYLFWWFFHQLALHFFYHSAFQYHSNLVERLDTWSAAGLGYSLGQFFMTKYTVLYGLPSALAKLDQVDCPKPPKCIGRIHLYSQMWRDFDRGLYNFMLRYIYIPLISFSAWTSWKLVCSALCFIFVGIWHGGTTAVVVWCVCNYIGICIEMTAKHMSKLPPLSIWKTNWTAANWLRFEAAACSPLLLISALSNFCFFTDANVGFILASKAILEGGALRLLFILVVMYCCCHVSMAVKHLKYFHTKKNK
uniref:EOG090X06SF n=1 Tax=Eubosmina coregoni TaxID=186181 RepID=A0A4Y7LL56_9CRUS|nr:EOG090X06SF [Eubosmina coregoni]